MIGPDYKRPNVNVGTKFKSPATQPAAITQIPRDWWTLFNDPVLNDLEAQAMKASPTLEAAMYRVEQARAIARQTYADLFPTIDFAPTIERARTPAGSSGTSNVGGGTGSVPIGSAFRARTRTTTRIPFDLNYELDVWGKYRRGLEAQVAQVRASEADYEVALQTLQADVATNYFSLRSLDLQQQIFEKTVASFQKQVELTQQQKGAGVVGSLEVAQAVAQLRSTLAQRTDIMRQRTDVEHALATLLGKTPAELNLEVRPLDLDPPIIPPGLTGDLLRRRPDVFVSEQNLITANAQVGTALTGFYPQIQLTGTAGFEAFEVKSALNWEQRVWSLGAGLTQPIFDAGRIQAQVDQARARYNEQLANYRNIILTAVRDVEDALTDLRLRAEQAQDQAEAVKASNDYLAAANRQYKEGVSAYFVVIDAERTLLNNEISAAQTLNQRLASTVLLIKSLGGGWDPDAVISKDAMAAQRARAK
jgi:multidrug efflux system outer membrane protein